MQFTIYHFIYFVSFCRVPRTIENYPACARSNFYKTTSRLTRENPRPRLMYMYVVTSIFDKFHRYRSRFVRSSNSPMHRERKKETERDCSYKHDCVYSSRNRRASSSSVACKTRVVHARVHVSRVFDGIGPTATVRYPL